MREANDRGYECVLVEEPPKDLPHARAAGSNSHCKLIMIYTDCTYYSYHYYYVLLFICLNVYTYTYIYTLLYKYMIS